MALLAFHSKCLRLLQISGAGKSLVVMTLNTPLLPLSINARWKMKHLISPSFSLPRVFRHSPSSLCVLRLHQTSYASSSSPSNGCFLLPAPTYGSSMSGTQVSPSWVFFLALFFPSGSQMATFTSNTQCARNSKLPSFFSANLMFFSPRLLLSCRERSLSTHCIAVDPVCVHRSCHTIQRSEELSCRPVSTLCCSLVNISL